MKTKLLFFFVLLLISNLGVFSQTSDTIIGYKFTPGKQLLASPVKDQANSGTCWAFAATSFFESEILRMTGQTYDLSEMFFVRNAYNAKAERFIRFNGSLNFGQGGQAHDVVNSMKQFGLLTEATYPGILPGEKKHSHAELESVLNAMLKSVASNPGRKLSPVWKKAFNCVVDTYLGEVPANIEANNSKLTPLEYMRYIGVNPNDYVEITSYSHHPYYEQFILEIPDNWQQDSYYNVPLDELQTIIDHALDNGYTVCWDGDVSDKGFSHNKGVAIVPDQDSPDLANSEKLKWEKMTEKDKQKLLFSFEGPVKEKLISQEIRQLDFDNHKATDDHLMHITGWVTDQYNTRYYCTKNSWNAESNEFGGYLNMSASYVRLNTIAIMVHKDAIPKSIARKLKIR
jgi:bleomycin hydrolase